MKITVGHTPDADDAFMFYGMLTGRIPSRGFEVEQIVEDIEGLNRRAINGELDVTAVSVHACAHAPGYTMLRSGGSFGQGHGPIVVARRDFAGRLEDARIAVPGTMTSAFLLLQIIIGRFGYTEMNFSDIPAAVRDGAADAGLVIHEGQLSYRDSDISKILDTGEWWDKATGLPVPLGTNVMKSSLGTEAIRRFDAYLQESITYGLAHRQEAVDYSMQYGRGNPRELIDRFVEMYVNPVTVDMGEAGEAAVHRMFQMARDRKLVSDFELRIAPPLDS